jgi:glycosyltransferase involved in cell wall biosynthesis
MKIALFDYFVDDSNAIGKFHAMLLDQLAAEHDFTVYSAGCREDVKTKVSWRKIRVPIHRPMFLLFLFFRIQARVLYWRDTLLGGRRYDLVQQVESYVGLSGLYYSHFCHKFFLKEHWKDVSRGVPLVKSLPRWLDHKLRSLCEAADYRKAERVIVPSQGLRRELEALYPIVAGKVHVLPNPIDIERMVRPSEFKRDVCRNMNGVSPGDTVFCFAALGHFERKGLPLLLEAFAMLRMANIKLWVVGGTESMILHYRNICVSLGIDAQVMFLGFQADVRPFLWASDAFVLPSYYEVFPTVALEASASGTPLISTRLNGVEEYIQDGHNGMLTERTVEGLANALRKFCNMAPNARLKMAAHGKESIGVYSEAEFVENWINLYRELDHASR